MARGRLLESDDRDLDPSRWSPPADLSTKEWEAFREAVAVNGLYVEYTLK